MDNALNYYNDKKLLITGCCGSVGKGIINYFTNLPHLNIEILGIDNDEAGIFNIDQQYRHVANVSFRLCDIRNLNTLKKMFGGVNCVIHTAALKHVWINEFSPSETITNNITGLQNILDLCDSEGIERFLFTSSDKAVNPTNVMGATKLLGERLVTAANSWPSTNCIYTSTRFGNVLGTSGSVVEIFQNQLKRGDQLTITHADMTRYVMTMTNAIELVLTSLTISHGGEVYVTKMKSVNIVDLAKAICELNGVSYKSRIIGTKPGEKLYEELITQEEITRTMELKNYFIVLPALEPDLDLLKSQYDGAKKIQHKNINSKSQEKLTIPQIKEILKTSI